MNTEKNFNLEEIKIPKSVGVILDGNRRWAKERGLPSFEGHKKGYQNIKNLVSWCQEFDIKNLTIYAFSTENWKRKEKEKNKLFEIFRKMFGVDYKKFKNDNVRINAIGRVWDFPGDIQEIIKKAEGETKKNQGIVLNVCLSYGGRAEILEAIEEMMKDDSKKIENLTEEKFEKYLWSGKVPDLDIIIRTGGEKRLSNFMTWKSVYSELFFTKTYWPSFTKEEFYEILREYTERERRMGK